MTIAVDLGRKTNKQTKLVFKLDKLRDKLFFLNVVMLIKGKQYRPTCKFKLLPYTHRVGLKDQILKLDRQVCFN